MACSDISLDMSWLKAIDLNHKPSQDKLKGMAFRDFCSECGDGTGLTIEDVLDIEDNPVSNTTDNNAIDTSSTTFAAGDSSDIPLFKHDCNHCVYLGSLFIDEDASRDFYFCEREDDVVPESAFLIRYGNDPNDYNIDTLCIAMNRISDGCEYDVLFSLIRSAIIKELIHI